MEEAAFELLEKLTQVVQASLRREVDGEKTDQVQLDYFVQINELDDLLDKARHEQKGGA